MFLQDGKLAEVGLMLEISELLFELFCSWQAA